MAKPNIGIFGLTGCAGEQIVILNCEDELLDLVGAVEIKDFLTASSSNDQEAHLDIAFVEGAVCSQRDEQALRRIRDRSDLLVAVGTCAVWGGVAAMEALQSHEERLREVYGEGASWYDALPARAVGQIVRVDMAISGCPIEKDEFLRAVANLVNGDAPLLPEHPVCLECKQREYPCLLIEQGKLCCGPITAGGCGARCPARGVACVGCRGPVDEANFAAAMEMLQERGYSADEIVRKLRTFAAPQAVNIASHGDD